MYAVELSQRVCKARAVKSLFYAPSDSESAAWFEPKARKLKESPTIQQIDCVILFVETP